MRSLTSIFSLNNRSQLYTQNKQNMDINATAYTSSSSFTDMRSKLNQQDSAGDKLKAVHNEIKQQMPFIERIAVILYDVEHDLLKSFIHSDDVQDTILQFYQSTLSDSESLSNIANSGIPRIVNDQGIFDRPVKNHSRFIAERNYGASHATPFYTGGQFAGLVFMNSRDKNVFDDACCESLSAYVNLIVQFVCEEIE